MYFKKRKRAPMNRQAESRCENRRQAALSRAAEHAGAWSATGIMRRPLFGGYDDLRARKAAARRHGGSPLHTPVANRCCIQISSCLSPCATPPM